MKPKILLVEDTREHINTIKRAAESWGYKVIPVTNLQDAKQILAADSNFGAIVTDLKIYEDSSENEVANFDSGLDLIKHIKNNHRSLPVIVFSVNNTKLKKELADLGVMFTIDKRPVKALDELKEMLENVIEPPRNSSQKIPIFQDNSAPDLDSLPKDLSGYKDDINKRIEKFPYDKNVFMMMKFRSTNVRLSNFIIRILAEYGLKGVRADDAEWNITKSINNPIAVLHCCKYGIALFDEPEENQPINPNVTQELGIMKNQGKECLMLVHKDTVPHLPFDIKNWLYETYVRQLDVEDILKEWLKNL